MVACAKETDASSLLPSLGEWFVLQTRSRNEKALADELAMRHIGHYLPLRRCVRYHGKRKASVEEPLFPGYVFLRGTREQAFQADRTKRVANIIHVPNQLELGQELANLCLALAGQATLDIYPYLRTGMRVEVRSGPFRGLQGVVESRSTMDRLILKVDILGRAVSMEIDGSLLEPMEIETRRGVLAVS